MDKNAIAVAVFDKRAAEYEARFMDVSHYRASLDRFCENLPTENAEILELACGPGNVTRYLLARRPDLKILATDLAPRMLELAHRNNPRGAEFQALDCREIASLDRKFDAVLCGFGLPYLSREEAVKLISDASQILKTNGLLFLGTMEGDYAKSGPQTSSQGDSLHLYFHEADYLVAALAANGFEILDFRRQDYPPAPAPAAAVDMLILAKA